MTRGIFHSIPLESVAELVKLVMYRYIMNVYVCVYVYEYVYVYRGKREGGREREREGGVKQ